MSNKKFPVILLKKAVVFPTEKVPLVLGGESIINGVREALQSDRLLVVVFQKNGESSEIGIVVKIIQDWVLSSTTMGVIIEGVRRVRISRILADDKKSQAKVEELDEEEEKTPGLEAVARSVMENFKQLVSIEGKVQLLMTDEIRSNNITPERVSDIVSAALQMPFEEKIEIIETLGVERRLQLLNKKLAKEISIVEAEKKIQREVKKEFGKTQREIILRERMKAIEKELGIGEEQDEYQGFEKKIRNAKMPPDVDEIALKELRRLRSMPPSSAEAPYIRTYLDWLTDLPWSIRSKSVFDLKKARVVLDEDHYGLEKTKDRILEYLAVQKLTKGRSRATIMCFVGPPGTGKTSVGKSIAKALGRKFSRISLGGIHDEAEIRGHRRTYVGALPGRIIQGIKNAKARNPVFMLDEIDKVGSDFRGDPSSALLEVLDPEQNNSFSDHYLEVPFDLSEIIFITTANILDPIPPALRDRMEVIEFSGYTDKEKLVIAKKFLLPRVLPANGLKESDLDITEKAVKKIINSYTKEAGVRELERKLSEVARKVARKIAENSIKGKVEVKESNLQGYIGPEEYRMDVRESRDEIGIATGMAWTPAGGEIIFIESSLMPGKGSLILTGHLGETMQESAKAALSYLRSRSKELGYNKNFYRNSDIHIHVPQGAIPKDGPSAGVAIAVSLASILTKRRVKKEVALTGEVTLSGKVLEVGGIKEKVLAAHRAGAEIIVMPKENKKNLDDMPKDVKKGLFFKFVSNIDEALEYALK